MRKTLAKDFKNIENEFFDLDERNKKAHLRLQFDKLSDIIDTNAITKTPVLSDEFFEWMKAAVLYAPRNYKVDLDVALNDMGGYGEEQLVDIFYKNILLESKKGWNHSITKNKIAIGLICLGLVLLIIMLLILGFWTDGGTVREVVAYVLDIMVTVTFWEAMTILIVENKMRIDMRNKLVRKYDRIRFFKKGEEE